MELFTIACPTCRARLKVRDLAAIGQILNCPKCGSMVQVAPPAGWQPPTEAQLAAAPPDSAGQISTTPAPGPRISKSPASTTPAPAAPLSTTPAPAAPLRAASTPLPGQPVAATSQEVQVPAGPKPARPKRWEEEVQRESEPAGATRAEAAAALPAADSATGASASAFPGSLWPTALWPKALWAKWALMAGMPAALLTIVFGLWMSKHSQPDLGEAATEPPTIEDVAAEASPPAVAPVPESTATAETELPARLNLPRQWLPTGVQAIVSLRAADLVRQPAADAMLARTAALWQPAVQRLLSAFQLSPADVRRVTWTATNLAALEPDDWLASGVLLLDLARSGNDTNVSIKGGVALDWKIDRQPVRRLANQAWPNPFVLLDGPTMLTGPEPLLKELAEREVHHLANASLDMLLDSWSTTAQVLAAIDLVALREAGAMPDWLPLVDVWHAERDDWQLARSTPLALGVSASLAKRLEAKIELVCEGESSAEQLRDALDRVLAAMDKTLSDEREGLNAQLTAGELKATAAADLNALLTSSQAALAERQLGVRGPLVWMEAGWQGDSPRLTTAFLATIPQLETARLATARRVDEEHHRFLLAGLEGYEKAEGKPPAGAAGAHLLPPDTRLSWLATLLPYYDHLDWRDDLNFARAWNDPINQPVTRRPLEVVVNPALGPSKTKAGFPTTHYVGVAGLGSDAGKLDPSDGRAGVFGYQPRFSRGEIPDGASNTIALAGVSGSLGPWASGGTPTVRSFTREPYINGPDGFGSGQQGGMVVGMADGSVRFLSSNIDPEVLRRLVTVNGGFPPSPLEEDPELKPPAKLPHSLADDEGRDAPDDTMPDQSGDDEPASDDPGEGLADNAEPDDDEPDSGDGPPAATGPLREADIAARLEDPIPGLEFNRSLAELTDLLTQFSTVPILIDAEGLAARRLKPDMRISLKLTDTTVGGVLLAALKPHGLKYTIVGQHVLVTDSRRGEHSLEHRQQNVADLTGGPGGAAAVVALIERFVLPASWQDSGGSGTIKISQGALEIDQTAPAQRQIDDFLARLRLARGLPVGRGDGPTSVATRFARAKERLEQPVTANFREPAPLKQIVAHLRTASNVKIQFDGLALTAAGLSPLVQAKVSADERPLADALNELLSPLKLSYRILDEQTLEITTAREARETLVVEFYPVRPLLTRERTGEQLADELRGRFAPKSWDEMGGAATVAFDAPGACLIVAQSQPVQIEIERWLSSGAATKPPVKK